jgi:prepilin-type N-terminal cleavage/methylation domain-containing protein
MIFSAHKQKEIPKGFTLIELMVYIFIIGLISVGMVTYSIDLTTSSQKGRIKIEVHQSARFAMDRVLQEIRAAESINVGSSTFGSSPGVLSLDVVNVIDDPTIFDVSGGVLRVKQGAAAADELTSSDFEVTNLIFENRSNSGRTSNVKIEFTLAHPNPTNSEIFDASITVKGSAILRKGSNP